MSLLDRVRLRLSRRADSAAAPLADAEQRRSADRGWQEVPPMKPQVALNAGGGGAFARSLVSRQAGVAIDGGLAATVRPVARFDPVPTMVARARSGPAAQPVRVAWRRPTVDRSAADGPLASSLDLSEPGRTIDGLAPAESLDLTDRIVLDRPSVEPSSRLLDQGPTVVSADGGRAPTERPTLKKPMAAATPRPISLTVARRSIEVPAPHVQRSPQPVPPGQPSLSPVVGSDPGNSRPSPGSQASELVDTSTEPVAERDNPSVGLPPDAGVDSLTMPERPPIDRAAAPSAVPVEESASAVSEQACADESSSNPQVVRDPAPNTVPVEERPLAVPEQRIAAEPSGTTSVDRVATGGPLPALNTIPTSGSEPATGDDDGSGESSSQQGSIELGTSDPRPHSSQMRTVGLLSPGPAPIRIDRTSAAGPVAGTTTPVELPHEREAAPTPDATGPADPPRIVPGAPPGSTGDAGLPPSIDRQPTAQSGEHVARTPIERSVKPIERPGRVDRLAEIEQIEPITLGGLTDVHQADGRGMPDSGISRDGGRTVDTAPGPELATATSSSSSSGRPVERSILRVDRRSSASVDRANPSSIQPPRPSWSAGPMVTADQMGAADLATAGQPSERTVSSSTEGGPKIDRLAHPQPGRPNASAGLDGSTGSFHAPVTFDPPAVFRSEADGASPAAAAAGPAPASASEEATTSDAAKQERAVERHLRHRLLLERERRGWGWS